MAHTNRDISHLTKDYESNTLSLNNNDKVMVQQGENSHLTECKTDELSESKDSEYKYDANFWNNNTVSALFDIEGNPKANSVAWFVKKGDHGYIQIEENYYKDSTHKETSIYEHPSNADKYDCLKSSKPDIHQDFPIKQKETNHSIKYSNKNLRCLNVLKKSKRTRREYKRNIKSRRTKDAI